VPHRAISEKLNQLVHFSYAPPEKTGEEPLSEADLFGQLRGEKTSSLFMGQYSKKQVTLALEQFGITGKLHQRGFENLTIEFKPRNSFEHRMTIRSPEHPGDDLLGELIVKEGHFRPTIQYNQHEPVRDLQLIFIEWMLMQRPGVEFSDRRKRLPGQNWPGLGVGRQVMKLLEWMTRKQNGDGLLNIPEFYHNAYFYSEMFWFYNPRKQAELYAIYRDLTELGLDIADVSFALYFDSVIDEITNKPYIWRAEEQICPITKSLERYFGSSVYAEQVAEATETLRFGLNRRLFQEKCALRDQIRW
jgi:hypothetical protein